MVTRRFREQAFFAGLSFCFPSPGHGYWIVNVIGETYEAVSDTKRVWLKQYLCAVRVLSDTPDSELLRLPSLHLTIIIAYPPSH